MNQPYRSTSSRRIPLVPGRRALAALTLLATSLLLAGCVSLQPARDKDQRVLLEPPADDLPRYTYPVRVVATPGYLQERTVYAADTRGNLRPIPGFLWADNPADSLERSLSLLLGSDQPPPEGTELRLRVLRFLLLENGSAEAVLAPRRVSPGQSTPLPLLQSRLPNAWTPSDPSTAPAAYQSLLESLPPPQSP